MMIEEDPISRETIQCHTLNRKHLVIEIDSLLERDIKMVNEEIQNQASLQLLDIRHQSPLLLKYIESNYHQYKIKNPFNKHISSLALAATQNFRSLGQNSIPTPQNKKKIMLTLNKNASGLITPKRISNTLYQDFSTTINKKKQERQTSQEMDDIIESEGNLYSKQLSTAKNSSHSKVHKSYFKFNEQGDGRLKTEPPKCSSFRDNSYEIIKISENPDDGSNKNSEESQDRLKNSERRPESRPLEQFDSTRFRANVEHSSHKFDFIKQSFRYCVGCEAPILEANTIFHENSCPQFKAVFTLNLNQFLEYLKTKIKSIELEVLRRKSEMNGQNISDLNNYSSKILEQSRLISESGEMTEGFDENYGRSMEISQRLCLVTQEINKLNWFLRIRESLKKKFDC